MPKKYINSLATTFGFATVALIAAHPKECRPGAIIYLDNI